MKCNPSFKQHRIFSELDNNEALVSRNWDSYFDMQFELRYTHDGNHIIQKLELNIWVDVDVDVDNVKLLRNGKPLNVSTTIPQRKSNKRKTYLFFKSWGKKLKVSS